MSMKCSIASNINSRDIRRLVPIADNLTFMGFQLAPKPFSEVRTLVITQIEEECAASKIASLFKNDALKNTFISFQMCNFLFSELDPIASKLLSIFGVQFRGAVCTQRHIVAPAR